MVFSGGRRYRRSYRAGISRRQGGPGGRLRLRWTLERRILDGTFNGVEPAGRPTAASFFADDQLDAPPYERRELRQIDGGRVQHLVDSDGRHRSQDTTAFGRQRPGQPAERYRSK